MRTVFRKGSAKSTNSEISVSEFLKKSRSRSFHQVSVSILKVMALTPSLASRGEDGQDQDWISCRIHAIFLDQDWIWILFFEKNWIRTGSVYLFDLCNETFLKVIQDVTNEGGSEVVFLTKMLFFTKNQNEFVNMRCTHHN